MAIKQQSNLELVDSIQIRGARTNNLKNIDVDIPRDALVCITGRSGSGKSSLAFGTLFAEGQRQYIESLSLYSRQFFDQMIRADVDQIHGLQPTLSLEQHVGAAGARSTVATITEIYDYLRVLMARAGEIRCHGCGEIIQQQTTQQIRDALLRLPENTKIMLLSPLVVGKKGRHQEVFDTIRKERLVRVRIDGELHDIDRLPELNSKTEHTIEAVTDRIIVREGIDNRLFESIELAARLGNGRVVAHVRVARSDGETSSRSERDQWFSTKYACPNCEISYPEVEPRTFSFNSPYGACEACHGLGYFEQFDPELVINDRRLSLQENAVSAWESLPVTGRKKMLDQLQPLISELGFETRTPLTALSDEIWSKFLWAAEKTAPGLMTVLEKELVTTSDESRREQLQLLKSTIACNHCEGSRLNARANSVYFDGRNIGQLTAMSIEAAEAYFNSDIGQTALGGDRTRIADPLLTAIRQRLRFLNQVGVGYLTLDRASQTLSGGEYQRMRLATSVGSGLTNVCYVLDEPSIGLHPCDNEKLIESIRSLKRSGNTVVVVEHDEAMIRAADYVIDIGPAAGAGGGRVVATGTPAVISANSASLTGNYLAGRSKIEIPPRRNWENSLKVRGASGFNLQDIDVEIPLGCFVCVTGVSGSGKSTLVNKTIAPVLARKFGRVAPRPAPVKSVEGAERIDKLVQITQRPLGRTSRGCAATYSGVFAEIRKLFAATKLAKERGFAQSRFSFNSKSGRCPDCRGHGTKRVKMNFLSDMFVQCETCAGQRYNKQTLQVRFRDLNIAEVLELSIGQALQEYTNFSRIRVILQSLVDVGLGYLPLGQPASTLSGGEAQRIKLATELATQNTGNTLYLLDEPTTGLHFDDTRQLLSVLQQLVELGNTVVVIEHNLELIKSADWIIDLGPAGGVAGGELVAAGTPEEVASNASSITGRFLQELLNG